MLCTASCWVEVWWPGTRRITVSFWSQYVLLPVFPSACDQEADLQDVCIHLATLELLVLGLVTGIVRLRAQKPVTVGSLM